VSDTLVRLLKLQQLDMDLLAKEQREKEIPQQVRNLELDVQQAVQHLEAQKRLHKETLLRQRALEKELADSTEQLRKKQARKFDVKSNEEYRALLKEIEFSESANSRREDEILMLLDEIDKLEQAIRSQEQTLRCKEEETRKGKETLEEEIPRIRLCLQELIEQRKSLCRDLGAEPLAEYEKIRNQRQGQAVVVVNGNVCPGCHLRVPPQTINEVLQTGEVRNCPHCRRILYCVLQEDSVSS